MKNALTVDLEDYFHVSAYAGKVRLEEWDSYPSRVAQNTDRLLELLAQHNCHATFFVLGWRAPSFSVTKKSSWALEILADEGFQYDSSIFPVEHPSYGIPDAPRTPYWFNTARGRILEFPLPTLSIGSKRSPIGGGAYLRLLPYNYTLWSIRYLNQHENFPVCVYIHPWELDPEQPRMGGRVSARARHYFGLRGK